MAFPLPGPMKLEQNIHHIYLMADVSPFQRYLVGLRHILHIPSTFSRLNPEIRVGEQCPEHRKMIPVSDHLFLVDLLQF